MAFFSITESDTELANCPEPDLASFANQECSGFHTNWCPVTVETAVTRGKELRNCKPKTPAHNECEIDIDYAHARVAKKYRKCHQTPGYAVCDSAPTPCGYCPQTCEMSIKYCKTSHASLSYHKQCPLRILELAAPSKRHCLDTWRNKSHILPDFMLERVRQYVMDETPLVQIPEAVHCFKRRVSNKSSRSCKSRVSDECKSDMKRYSAKFAYCVAQKLDKPLNITLNSELEKISNVISHEISRVTKKNDKKANVNNKKNKFDKKMQDEMSKKVTAWIDNVLDETSENLLEDDIKELEEQEGPVLDIIDDLVNKVMDLCEPDDDKNEDENSKDIKPEESATDSKSETSATLSNTAEHDVTKGDDEDGNDQIASNTAENDVTKDVNDLIESNTAENDVTKDGKNLIVSNTAENDVTKDNDEGGNDQIENNVTDDIHKETDQVNKLDATAEHIDIPVGRLLIPSTDDFNVATDFNAVDDFEAADDFVAADDFKAADGLDAADATNDDLNIGKDDIEHDITGEIDNVSETFKKYSEESLHEQNIKVTLSNKDIAGESIELENQKQDDKRNWMSQHSITFAPPNEFLLSDADEVWPGELSTDTARASATVSKSITTLGFLDEKDEIKVLDANLNSSEIKPHNTDTKNNVNIGEAGDELHDIETEELLAVHASNFIDDALIKYTTTTDETEHSNLQNNELSPTTKDKIDYKVDARTAPLWVLTGHCDRGGGEPQTSLPEEGNKDENEAIGRDLQIWNHNLQIVCANLQTWHDWIEITCKNIRHIKRKSERNKSDKTCTYRQKDKDLWIKLERYIKNDSDFWLKYQYSAKRRLKAYKSKYRYRTKAQQYGTSLNCFCKMTSIK